nr:BatD family protein [Pseudidiomarina sediminum]
MIRTFFIVVFTVILTCSPNAYAQATASEVIISVDKNPVGAGDTFVFTLTVDTFIDDTLWQPAEVLESMEVMGTSSSTSTQIINGETTRQQTFRSIIKAPNQLGSYILGPVTLAGVTSNSINLSVLAADDPELQEKRQAFMRVELGREEVYVQEQVDVTAKLYLAANLHSGNIIPPQLDDADIRQIGSDQDTTEVIDGRLFQVFTRRFVVIPQRSGEQVIRGPMFQGQINVDSQRTMFPTFSATKSITTAATDITLNVLPSPSDWPATQTWLPAELVSLAVSVGNEASAQDSNAQLQITQGEPITFTYRLTAVGPNADQLPRLDTLVKNLAIANASVYPETPESAMTQRNGSLVSQQTLRVAVIPHQAGSLEIPALTVPWFNTILRQTATATAPAQQLSVAPSTGTPSTPAPAATQTEPTAADTDTDTSSESPTATTGRTTTIYWQVATAVLVVLWLATLAWLFGRGKQQRAQHVAQAAAEPPRFSLNQLKQACLANDAKATELALKQWMRDGLQLPSQQFQQLAAHFNHAPLRGQLEHLQRCRYAAVNEQGWHEGKALWRAIQAALQAKRQHQAKGDDASLPKLYPQA